MPSTFPDALEILVKGKKFFTGYMNKIKPEHFKNLILNEMKKITERERESWEHHWIYSNGKQNEV